MLQAGSCELDLGVIVTACPRLAWLDLHGSVLRPAGAPGAPVPQARELVMCDLRQVQSRAANGQLEPLAQHVDFGSGVLDCLPEVRVLALSATPPAALQQLGLASAGQAVTHLYADDAATGTDGALVACMQALPSLRLLALAKPRQVDWLDVRALGAAAPHLEVIVQRGDEPIWPVFTARARPHVQHVVSTAAAV